VWAQTNCFRLNCDIISSRLSSIFPVCEPGQFISPQITYRCWGINCSKTSENSSRKAFVTEPGGRYMNEMMTRECLEFGLTNRDSNLQNCPKLTTERSIVSLYIPLYLLRDRQMMFLGVHPWSDVLQAPAGLPGSVTRCDHQPMTADTGMLHGFGPLPN
jgi:hypothetical protein